MRFIHHAAVLAAIYSCAVPRCAASAWPSFRGGPQNLGRSDIAVEKAAARRGSRRPWRSDKGGLFWATAVIDARGVAYLGSTNKSFYALGPAGNTLWSYRILDRPDSLIDSTAVLASTGLVVVPGGDGYLHGLDRRTGKRRWLFQSHGVSEKTHSSGEAVNSFEGNVTTDGERLYAGSDNAWLYAVDFSGKELWSFRTGMMVWSLPAFDPARRWLAFGSLDGSLYLLDPANGRLLDRFRVGSEIKSSPAVSADGTIYVGASDGRFRAFTVETGPTGSLHLKQQWSFSARDEIYSSPAVGADRVYFASLDGSVYALSKGGALIWEYRAHARFAASPLLTADGRLFVGARNGVLYCLDANTGERLWSYRTARSQVKSNLDSSPAISPDGRIVVGSYSGKVYSIPYEYCFAHRDDPDCAFGGREDFPGFGGPAPRDGAVLRYEDREGLWKERPDAPVTAAGTLRFRLLDFANGRWIENAAIDPAGLRARLTPPAAFTARVSSDRQWLDIVPERFLAPGTRYRLEVSGRVYRRTNWFWDRFKWLGLPAFSAVADFETAKESGDAADVLARDSGRPYGFRALFLHQPQALETYIPAALDGQDFIVDFFGIDAKSRKLHALALPAQITDHGFVVMPEPKRAFLLDGDYEGREFHVGGTLALSAMGSQLPVESSSFSGILRDDGSVEAGQFFLSAPCWKIKGSGSSYQFPLPLIDKVCDHRLRLLAAGRYEADRLPAARTLFHASAARSDAGGKLRLEVRWKTGESPALLTAAAVGDDGRLLDRRFLVLAPSDERATLELTAPPSARVSVWLDAQRLIDDWRSRRSYPR